MTDVPERPDAEPTANEVDSLLGLLEFQRATLAWKCDGLDATGLRATVGASTMTLGGLLNHLSLVEDHWFSHMLHAREQAAPWCNIDWDADPDWEWITAADHTPDELRERWRNAAELSRAAVAAALEEGDLDQRAQRRRPNGESPSLRWILLHMIEEYARHNGHADLLRESIDGSVGT